MNKIIPGILDKKWSEIERKLEIAKTFTDTIHIDIIDGRLVNNLTFLDPEPFKKYSSQFFLELHMMVENPIEFLEPFGKAGFNRFLGHIEQMPDQKKFIDKAKELGEAGLALDGPTSINDIKVPFENLDSILVYTSDRIGFSGPPLLQTRLEKIKGLRSLTDIQIGVDGGINDATISLAKEAGATRFVATSFIFGNGSPEENFRKLQACI